MRIGTNSSDEFSKILNKKYADIQNNFLNNIKTMTEMVSVKVMLGDSTVTEQSTFDPLLIKNFYEKIIKKLHDWNVQDITITNNEGLRRIFTKFQIREGNYLLSGHMSQQFHVLLYYKLEQRVIECQKELAEIIDKTKDGESKMANLGDKFILDKLKEMGYSDLDNQKLFEIFFSDDKLREKFYENIEQKSDMNFQKLIKKKTKLFNELDNLIIELYQTTSVLLDDAKLVSGEEGCLCTFDLEFIKNKNKEGLFDTKKIPKNIKQNIIQRMDQFSNILKK